MDDGDRILADAYAIESVLALPVETLRSWVKRGRLQRRGTDNCGRTLYDFREVCELRAANPQPRHSNETPNET